MFLKKSLFVFCLFLCPTAWSASDNTTDDPEVQKEHTLVQRVLVSYWRRKKPLKKDYGLRGLLQYADQYFTGDVPTAYTVTANFLDTEKFKQLGWGKYEKELNQIKEKITFFYIEKKLNKEALKLTAQMQYASLYHNDNMLEAFHSARLILGDKMHLASIEKRLKWVKYPGSITEFIHIQNILFKNKKFNPEYNELSGQMRFANTYYNGNIQRALDTAQMTVIHYPYPFPFIPNGWIKGYTGSTSTLNHLLKILEEEINNLKKNNNTIEQLKYANVEGQIILGEKAGIKNMLTLYNNILSIENIHISKEVSYNLQSFLRNLCKGWIQYDGSPEEFEIEKSIFFDKRENLRPDIITINGLATLAQKYYHGNMELAFDRAKVILQFYKISTQSLYWSKLKIDSNTFFQEQEQLYNKNGTIKNEYLYPTGLAKYSKDYHNDDMHTGYKRGSVLLKLTNREINRNVEHLPFSLLELEYIDLHLGWSKSAAMSTSTQFWKTRQILLDKKEKPKKEWEGVEGQIRYAKKYTNGSMLTAWQTHLYIFGLLKGLNWQIILKDAKQVEEQAKQFFNPDGKLKEQYKQQNGYMLYAKKHTNGNLTKAFMYMKYLPSSIQKNLNWYYYQGSIEDLERDIALFPQYQDMEGLIRFASKFYKGYIIKAYYNILTIFKGDKEKLYKEMGWLPYYNTVLTFRYADQNGSYKKDKQALLTEKGDINPLYKGQEGYIRFADKYYDGYMLVAYRNARAVLETQNLLPIMEWNLFPGTTDDFKKIAEFMLNPANTEVPLLELTPRQINILAGVFAKKNNILSIHKKNIRKKITAFLAPYKSTNCSRIL